jgi:transposase-like protein
MSNSRTFSGAEQAKLTQVINEGMQVMHEIETLTGGLNDTVKAIAEEMDIKPNILKKAIKLAHKAEFGRGQQDHELLETILTSVGKTLQILFSITIESFTLRT